MKYVIFDFNGTVVDDVDLSLDSINYTIKAYLDRDILTKEEYREVFTFPIKDYYEDVGFDFNKLDWIEVGHTWVNYYKTHRKEAKLHNGIIDVLQSNIDKGYKNILLSASEINTLKEHLKELEVYDYFDEILGIDNIYGTTKLPIAQNFIKDKDPNECILIGDSGHDKEVADEINVRCALVSKGHESKRRLCEICDEVYDDISEVNL